MIKYTSPSGADWQVMADAELKSFFGVSKNRMPELHRTISNNPGAWAIVTRLYGIWPIVPDPGTDASFLKVWTVEEICQHSSIDRSELDAHLDAAKNLWVKYLKVNPEAEVPLEPKPETPKKRGRPKKSEDSTSSSVAILPPKRQDICQASVAAEVLSCSSDSEVIESYGFSMTIFGGAMSDDHRASEIKWFSSRLQELRKLFAEPMARSLARQAVINELLLRRCDDQMTLYLPGSKEFSVVVNTKVTLEDRYQKQWTQLEEICPWAKSIGDKQNFAGVVSDLVSGVVEWEAHRNNKLIDGLFTAYEVQVMMRSSVQDPAPRYRPGWNTAVLEAMGGIFDPKWQRKLPNAVVRQMDEGFREAQFRLQEQGKVTLPDLERMDASGEYPPLFEAPEETAEDYLAVPVESVRLDD